MQEIEQQTILPPYPFCATQHTRLYSYTYYPVSSVVSNSNIAHSRAPHLEAQNWSMGVKQNCVLFTSILVLHLICAAQLKASVCDRLCVYVFSGLIVLIIQLRRTNEQK